MSIFFKISCLECQKFFAPISLSMKQGNLFCFVCHIEISQTTALHAMLLMSLESSLWVGGALTWFETVWSYGVEAIDYWTIFSMKTNSNQNWKQYWDSRVCLMLLESPRWRVRFNRVYFTIFRAKVWKKIK
jgi:hypothetical protein